MEKFLKIFDSTSEFPLKIDEINSRFNSNLLSQISNLKSELIDEDIELFLEHFQKIKAKNEIEIQEKFNEYSKIGFYFKLSNDYLNFMNELGIERENSFLFCDPFISSSFILFNDTYDVELFQICNFIGEDFRVLNEFKIKQEIPTWDIKTIESNIKSYGINSEYLIERLIDYNNFAKTDYKECYLPHFEERALDLIKIIKAKN
ncbi:MAG: hypothetical protein V4622_14395 [Bacteroidota bacterium]